MITSRHHFFNPSPAELARTDRRLRARSLTSVRDGLDAGVWQGGEVTEVDDTRFAHDYRSGGALLWPDTTIPVPQLIITVATEVVKGERIESGDRAIWVPRNNVTKYRALCKAMEGAGLAETLPQVGGHLYVKYEKPTDLPPNLPITPRVPISWEMCYTPADDELTYIKDRLERLEYERHGTAREDIMWLVNEVERLRQLTRQ